MIETDISQDPPRRGPGRPPKPRDPPVEAVSEQITYLPGPEDPVSTKFHGHVFHANVPKTITNYDLVKKLRDHPNPYFKLGTFDPNTDKAPIETFVGEPKTSDQYKAHAVGWIKKCTDIEDMAKTWVAEQRIREMCDVGTDDYAWLGTIFIPKMHDLARRAELNDSQLSQLWQRYGVFSLPF